jgi:hypothetical protein
MTEWGCSQVIDLVRRTELDCPHALGTNTFSRIMIPRLPLRLRSGLRQRRDFGSGLRRPLGAQLSAATIAPFDSFAALSRSGQAPLFTTDAGRRIFESALERVRRSFRLQVYGYVVMRSIFIFCSASHSRIRPATELSHSSRNRA